MPFNAHESLARERKTTRVADHIVAAHDAGSNKFTDLPAALTALPQSERDKLTAAAGERACTVYDDGSCPSWDMIVAKVRHRLALRESFAADPFAGLVRERAS